MVISSMENSRVRVQLRIEWDEEQKKYDAGVYVTNKRTGLTQLTPHKFEDVCAIEDRKDAKLKEIAERS